MKYVVKQNIWHTGDNVYYFPGDVVSLDHLDQDRIDKLIKRGSIVPETAQKAKEKSEVKDGSNN